MAKYRVWFTAGASHSVDVEAANEDAALDAGIANFSYPSANMHNEFNLGDWEPDDGGKGNMTNAVEEIE